MIDYFLIYRCILEVIHDEHSSITDAFKLFEFLSEKEELFKMRETFPQKIVVEATLEVLDNLIDDGLIIAKRYHTADGTLYQIKRLSTAGHSYLLSLQKTATSEKVKDFLKSEGLPLTPKSVSKAIANLLW
ncbi:phage protein [Streptococcus dysgalactiae]|uniref:hypothetical protein n=2 Tax=Streptococcus TaxID=1301 RepID=UPI000D948EE1|nr:hypothetical protein [Streptococcus pyogenes]GET71728.1 hypothetical protein KNZ04_02180 [Streptococcus dysgalactiae subsp. equisimilis]SQB38683.1 phage protein [Streptococcus dysgalactiae]SQB66554.1 phage protein [Streptococcus dysgalactiae]VHF63159.1 phage protein [Streptococcus pyogenes]